MDLEYISRAAQEAAERMEAERLAGMPDPRMGNDFNKLTNMAFWWPRILHTKVPKPMTELVPIPYLDASNAMMAIDRGRFDEAVQVMFPHMERCVSFLMAQSPQAMFMRSFFHSAKHEVPSTKIERIAQIAPHLVILLEETMMKDIPFEGLALREFMYLDSPFTVFNGMPLAKERRVIIEANSKNLSCRVYPYWPLRAISSYSGHTQELPPDWQHRLAKLNAITGMERDILSQYAMILYKELMFDHPNWTFDFVQTKSGQWYFIDAAALEQSWRPDLEEETYGALAAWGCST